MKVLWTHNFDPNIPSSGSFMHVFADGMRRLGISVDLLYLGDLSSPSGLLSARNNILRVSKRYDLTHAQFGSACALATIVTDGPKIISLRGSDWHRYRDRFNKDFLHSAAATAMTKFALKYFNVIIVMSERMKAEVELEHPNLLVYVLPDPIDLSKFLPLDKMEARNILGCQDRQASWILFTTLSRSNPIKRVQLAEEAVRIVERQLENVELRVASGIRHDQMPMFVASCDMVLSTSFHEGWPNCVKEALACNLPFVATDVSDLAHIAAKESSCHITSSEPNQIAARIMQTLQHKKPELRHYVEGMDLDISCAKLLNIYEQIVSRHRGALNS